MNWIGIVIIPTPESCPEVWDNTCEVLRTSPGSLCQINTSFHCCSLGTGLWGRPQGTAGRGPRAHLAGRKPSLCGGGSKGKSAEGQAMPSPQVLCTRHRSLPWPSSENRSWPGARRVMGVGSSRRSKGPEARGSMAPLQNVRAQNTAARCLREEEKRRASIMSGTEG